MQNYENFYKTIHDNSTSFNDYVYCKYIKYFVSEGTLYIEAK